MSDLAPVVEHYRNKFLKDRRALLAIVDAWKHPRPALEGETPLETAIAERDTLYAIAAAAVASGESSEKP